MPGSVHELTTVQISVIKKQYYKQAIGPAAREMLEKGHRELQQKVDLLKKIPGPPGEVEVIGRGSD